MNTVFRKIRQKLLKESKFSKYLLYAIGEIVLVMIGILLALYINNLNQARANEAKVATILKEIQSDLIIDIEGAKVNFDQYVESDSMVKLVLNNQISEEEYREGVASDLGMSYRDYLIATNGYDNLRRNLDKVPTKFQDLQKDLKFLYVTLYSNGLIYSNRMREIVFKNADQYRSEVWYQERLKGNVSDEQIDYFMNDIQYKNKLASFMEDRRNVFKHSQMVRVVAIDLYKEIHEVLASTDSIPEIVNYICPDTSLLNRMAGKYQLKESINDRWSEFCELSIEDGELYFNSEYDENKKLLWHEGASFFRGFGSPAYAIFDRSGNGDLYLDVGINTSATYERVEE